MERPLLKQEHTTSLSSTVIARKTHPRIELRGQLDALVATVVLLQIKAHNKGQEDLIEELEEIRNKIYELIEAEVTGKPCAELALWGLTADEIRARSHNPARVFGIEHIRPHYTMGELAAGLNELRTKVRKAELAACRAFATPEGTERPDIVTVLNRLSSAVYILTYKYLPDDYEHVIFFGKSPGG